MLGALAALAILALAPLRYEGEAMIELAPRSVEGWAAAEAHALLDAGAMETERRLLLAPDAVARVARRLDLAATEEFGGPGAVAGPEAEAARRLATRLSTRLLGDSRLIAVQARSADPALAARIAAALAEDRLQVRAAARAAEAHAAADRLAARLSVLDAAPMLARSPAAPPDATAPLAAPEGAHPPRFSPPFAAAHAAEVAQPAPPRASAEAHAAERRALLARLAEARTAAAMATPQARLVSTQDFGRLSGSSLALILPLTLGGGLALGGALAWLRETGDGPPLSAAMAAQDAGAPALAAVPRAPGRGDPVAFARRRPGSALAEGARRLRQGLRVGREDDDDPARVLAVLSPGPGEGKSTAAALLAESCARAGLRTALVDADVRSPVQARRYGLSGATGLLSVLAGEATASEAMRRPVEGGPWLLCADPATARGAERLAGPAMARLVAELRRRFDVVILDTPPLLSAAEAQALASLADRRLLAMRWGETRRGDLRAAADVLRECGRPADGLVLCAAPRRSGPDPAARRPRYGAFLEGFDD